MKEYKLNKTIFTGIYNILSGYVFYKDIDPNTVTFKFVTKAFEKHFLSELDKNNIPYTT